MSPVLNAFLSQTADGAPAGGLSPLILFAAMIGVFYFVLWRPQAKERKKLQEFVTGLKRGDEVVTQGGMVGLVFQVEDRTVTLDVGAGTKIRVLKSYVAGPFKPAEPAPAKLEAKK